MLDVILVSNFSMKEELGDELKLNNYNFHDLMIQDIHHIERYPVDGEYNTIIIQSANAIKKIDSSNNHIYSAENIYGIGPNCRAWVKKKFSLECVIPEENFSSDGLIERIQNDNKDLGKTLLLKGIGGKDLIKNFLADKNINFKTCDVYERVLNEGNLTNVINMVENGAIIIGFSRSSIEPLLESKDVDLKKLHFLVLDKSEEDIIKREDVGSLNKIVDIYDINQIVEKVKSISE